VKDLLGVFSSGLCLCHCLLTPLLLALGVLGGAGALLESEWLHGLLLVPMLMLAALSLPDGWRLHRNRWPLGFAVLGFLLLFVSFASEALLETLLAVSASLLVATAHLLNRQLLVRQSTT